MDRAEHISIEQTSALPADELDRCDFSFDIAWELNAPYQDLLDLRALPARRKHYGFDPAGWADETFSVGSAATGLTGVLAKILEFRIAADPYSLNHKPGKFGSRRIDLDQFN